MLWRSLHRHSLRDLLLLTDISIKLTKVLRELFPGLHLTIGDGIDLHLSLADLGHCLGFSIVAALRHLGSFVRAIKGDDIVVGLFLELLLFTRDFLLLRNDPDALASI